MGKRGLLLRTGYGLCFLAANGIVLAWAQAAANIMEVLEDGGSIKSSLLGLLVFAAASLLLYGALTLCSRKQIAVFEGGYVKRQGSWIQSELTASKVSRKYSELELINRVTDDLRRCLEWSCKGKTEFFLAAVVCGGIFFYLCFFSIATALLIYGIMILNLVVPLAYNRHMIADYSRVMQANDNWAGRLQEGIENLGCIQSLGAEEAYSGIYEKAVREFIDAARGASKTSHTEMGIKNGMNQFSNYLGYAMVGLFVVAGSIDLGMAARTILLIPQIQNILNMLVEKNGERRNVTVSKKRLEELESKEKPGTQVPAGFDLEVRSLTFGYGDENIFENLTYHIGAGKTVLIKGENGTGKSTLLKLFTGFYQAKEGKILMGGISNRDILPEWLCTHVFYLPQNNLYIPGTVADNLKLRGLSSQGMDASFLAKDITQLSEGQKKQIALRELYGTDKEILLLDEPENHLDGEALEKLVEFLREDGRTTVIVTHTGRFDEIADGIWNLRDGGRGV